jgi:hypothetical protein
MEADGHAVSSDGVQDRGEDEVTNVHGVTPQQGDRDRDGRERRDDE